MSPKRQTAVALTIAGSDSGGGAGIQADLKTFRALGVFGASAITGITAQNPRRISAVYAIPPRIVAQQIERVLEAFPVGAVKTGMLCDAAIISAVAAVLQRHRVRRLVVDPVMIASSGARLLRRDGLAALTDQLLPQAMLVTPNLAEAGVLLGRRVESSAEMRAAARALAGRFGTAFLVKGGHQRGARRVVDVLCDGRDLHEFAAARVTGITTHGTGCTLSAAVTANLALGHGLAESVARAKQFVTRSIRQAVRVGRFHALHV
jgi:hydroxymethylpyrimidine/phosphomethylpyrimidine kinase